MVLGTILVHIFVLESDTRVSSIFEGCLQRNALGEISPDASPADQKLKDVNSKHARNARETTIEEFLNQQCRIHASEGKQQLRLFGS